VETEILCKFFTSLPMILEGPKRPQPSWGAPPPIRGSGPAFRRMAGSMAVPPLQRRCCKNRVLKNQYNNRIVNLVSGFNFTKT
jgi:hypothetical protein